MDVNGLEIIDNLPQGIFHVSFSSNSAATTTGCSMEGRNMDDISSPMIISNLFPSYDMQIDNTLRYIYDALISGLQIASQLARHSEEHYAILYRVFTAKKLSTILTSNRSLIRAKGCNLIGNLCR